MQCSDIHHREAMRMELLNLSTRSKLLSSYILTICNIEERKQRNEGYNR
jgi:hypothetical protein